MYKSNRGQTSLFDIPVNFIGAKLNPKNRWIKMSALIPWDLLDEKYSEQFRSETGNLAKPARMALGAHIIREKYGISDVETLEHIVESPYLQWFIGLPEFTDKAPFDASTMTWFRKRLTPEMIAEVNSYIIDGSKRKRDDNDHPGSGNSNSSDDEENDNKDNKGTLILDATCATADIKYPTGVSLLSDAREKLKNMITTLHKQISEGKKPRTYKKRARRDYLRFVRSKRQQSKKYAKRSGISQAV